MSEDLSDHNSSEFAELVARAMEEDPWLVIFYDKSMESIGAAINERIFDKKNKDIRKNVLAVLRFSIAAIEKDPRNRLN